MLDGFRAVWRGIMAFETYASVFVVANLVTLLCSLPIVTAPAAFGALVHLAHTAHRIPSVYLSTYWEGLRENLGRGLILGIANVAVAGMLWVNLTTYLDRGNIGLIGLRVMWVITGAFWIIVQFYVWPILEEMEKPALWGALRNSLVMALGNPLFTLAIFLCLIVIMAFSVLLVVPLVLIAPAVLANVASTAVLDRLDRFRGNSPE